MSLLFRKQNKNKVNRVTYWLSVLMWLIFLRFLFIHLVCSILVLVWNKATVIGEKTPHSCILTYVGFELPFHLNFYQTSSW